MKRKVLKPKQLEFLEWFVSSSGHNNRHNNSYGIMSNRIIELGWYDDSDIEYLNYLRKELLDEYIKKDIVTLERG